MNVSASNVSVASITTAYNAARILPRHIDALLAQSRPIQEVVIVNNGSADGTCAMLAEKYPQVTVLHTGANLGAAGAWAAGLDYAAIRKRHDWVWSFDDDSIPGPNTLETLLTGVEEIGGREKIGMAVPLPVNEQSGIPYPPLLWRDGFVKPSPELIEQPVWFADLAIASGALIRRQAIETIGLPRADFFMDFFDFEYSLRMRGDGFIIAVITGCKFSHEIGNARPVRLLGLTRLWPDYAPWREYYLSRNVIYAVWNLYPNWETKKFAVMHLLRHGIGVVLFGNRKLAVLRKMLQGASDGRHGKLGIRFSPGNQT